MTTGSCAISRKGNLPSLIPKRPQSFQPEPKYKGRVCGHDFLLKISSEAELFPLPQFLTCLIYWVFLPLKQAVFFVTVNISVNFSFNLV